MGQGNWWSTVRRVLGRRTRNADATSGPSTRPSWESGPTPSPETGDTVASASREQRLQKALSKTSPEFQHLYRKMLTAPSTRLSVQDILEIQRRVEMRVRAELPRRPLMRFGLQPADNSYAVSWLAMVAQQPWHGVPLMFALVDHGDHLHPWGIASILDGDDNPVERPSLLAEHISAFPFDQLPEREAAIMAVGFMRETYLGEREGSAFVKTHQRTGIGDEPDDVLVRRVVVAFAGGNVQHAVHIRETNDIGTSDAICDDYQPGLVDQLQRVMAALNTGVLPR